MDINWVALIVLILLFARRHRDGLPGRALAAARRTWQSLHEWGLGGKSFGTITTWFLLGGDLYTAYTFVAVPAAMWATGAVSGFFAVPYTIVLYPIIFFFLGRMWSVAHRHGYVTTADIVQGRYGTRSLSLAVAVTGILATMPYIALQLVGIQAVLEVVGLGGNSLLAKDLPLLIAFAVLAAYTYSSGLRAPAMIAFVKDTLIYLVIAVAIIYLPLKFGGWVGIFDAAQAKMAAPSAANPAVPTGVFIPGPLQHWAYASLALGSALALFMYPHCVTATLSSKDRSTGRRNAAILPAYSLLLGLLALLGYVAIKAGTHADRAGRQDQSAAGHPAAVRGPLPELVHRGRLRRDRHRGPGAGGDHVDRGGQPVHPQHLQGLPEAGGDRRPGGQGLQDRLA